MDADQSKTLMVSTETNDKTINQNIEALKKTQKREEDFNEIYSTLICIATDNDFSAMNFVVKEKYFDVRNENDETIFDRSIRECNFHLAHLIIEFCRHKNDNYYHNVPKNSDFMRFMLKTEYIDANDVLIWASFHGNHEVVKLLLAVPGIDVNAKDNWDRTALMLASEEGYHEVVKLLLTVPGIYVNARDIVKDTVLMKASKYGHHEIVKHLLTVPGIDVNAKDINNYTALMLASKYGHHEVVNLLLTVPGIDINAKDNGRWTALMKASKYGHHEVVNLLLTVPAIDQNEIMKYWPK